MTNQQSREGVETQVAERATRDPKFRQELLANPRQTLQQELGITIPESVEVKVVEESASTFYLVLPPASTTTGHHLSDEDLAQVAGGWSGATDCGTCYQTCTCDMRYCPL